MLKDFKEFVLRGNVVDLAVGVVVGAAFGAVVAAFVADFITPLIAIPGSTDFGDLDFTIRDSVFRYGHFFNALISFLLIAASVFFFVVRPVNHLMNRRRTKPDAASETQDCEHCLSSIPAGASVCMFCTRDVVAAA